MALDVGGRPRSTSPSSSGRASPAPRQPTLKAEENLLRKDKSYRRYTSNVERALSLFDTALQEWADYISFLGRLLKALQSHPPNVKAVPRSAVVASRLAQCLNPSLPSGVHHKALELYTFIFDLIGKDGLARDLALYLPGLSSTLSFASLSVRPYFLSLVESHLIILQPSALRPALRALILALLPGLEDETSEDFERTYRVIENLRVAVRSYVLAKSSDADGYGNEYFWQCFFLASITSPGRRQGALGFLTRKLPKLIGIQKNGGKDAKQDADLSPAAEAIVSPEPGLLIRCFAAGLTDEQLLIQRGFLDLLVTHLPLDSPVLQDRVIPEDLDRLVTAAVGVVARREMSLNRRLWTWFLGPEPMSNPEGNTTPSSPASPKVFPVDSARETLGNSRTQYFRDYGLRSLIRSIHAMIDRETRSVAARARPYRICLSLMDRWEVGGLVVPEIFLSVVQSVQKYKTSAPGKDDFTDVLRSATVFFDGVESGLIWGELLGLIASALESGPLNDSNRYEMLKLVEFVIENFNIREEEMLLTHIPIVALAIVTLIDEQELNRNSAELGGSVPTATLNLALRLADQLVTAIPQRAYVMESANESAGFSVGSSSLPELLNTKVLRSIRDFYVREQGNIAGSSPPFPTKVIEGLLLQQTANLVSRHLESNNLSSPLEIRTRILNTLMNKSSQQGMVPYARLFSAFHQSLTLGTMFARPASSFATLSAIISTVTTLKFSKATLSDISAEDFDDVVHLLVCQAWKHLSPSAPKYHVETVRCLWLLHLMDETRSDRKVEASLSALMVSTEEPKKTSEAYIDSARKFTVLWTHSVQAYSGDSGKDKDFPPTSLDNTGSQMTLRSANFGVMLTRPLFLLLDALASDDTQMFAFSRDWIENLPSIHRLFQVLATKLHSLESCPGPTLGKSESELSKFALPDVDDLEEYLYYLKTLSNILRWSSGNVWSSLANQKAFGLNKSFDSSFQRFFADICLRLVTSRTPSRPAVDETMSQQLHRAALSLLQQLLLNPYSVALGELELEHPLIACLYSSLHETDASIQALLLDVIYAALKLRPSKAQSIAPTSHRRTTSKETIHNLSRLSLSENSEKEQSSSDNPSAPPELIKCIQDGISSRNTRAVLDSWINFLVDCLPLFAETIFQILIPLVECLCNEIRSTFSELRSTFSNSVAEISIAPESTILLLLHGLEQVLARAHDRLTVIEVKNTSLKSPEQPQGFFGNMVSGVFASEGQVPRSATANDRLTVLLSFQDTVRICFSIWSWSGHTPDDAGHDPTSHASFTYTSLRMRNRARRILEHLFAAEPLECLETLAVLSQDPATPLGGLYTSQVLNLLHVLDGSRPKNTIPAIFNAIYSRTNPNALDPMRKSTLTSDLTDVDLVAFLVKYARSLEDDAMDEIWSDCMTFLRDVLANPFPHRQTLPRLLEFIAIIGEKVDNTNFGEQRRMRRELGDLFMRLLTASFTTKPIGFSQEIPTPAVAERSSLDSHKTNNAIRRPQLRSDDLVAVLVSIIPHLPTILFETERINGVASTISINVISPTFRSKMYPENITKSILDLLYQLSKLPNAAKSWKKDIADAFNDQKFFSNAMVLVESNWLPLLGQWALADKDRLSDLLSRISAPTTAGIMFGVGASSARLEADRKTQLNLRRIATVILAAADDSFVTNLSLLEAKIVELLAATAASSPSSTTRAEVYMVFRALVLKTSAVHLASFWPIFNSELHGAISSLLPGEQSDVYSSFTLLQACKLLDTLLTIAPDDFQLHEWLYITDTIDAVYRPTEWNPVALVDELSEELGSSTTLSSAIQNSAHDSTQGTCNRRKPLLQLGGIKDVDRDDIVGKVLKPFFSQLSIYAFESTYAMGTPDWETCSKELLSDLFDDTTIAG